MTRVVHSLPTLRARSEQRNRGPPSCTRGPLKRERPGWHPVSQTTARERPHMKRIRTLPGRRTDAMSVSGVCVPLTSARSIASTAPSGSGDGLQPSQLGSLSPSRSAHPHVLGRSALSYRAIAAALALEDVSVGERLVAYSLASYAGRDHRAWPAARTAAVRAGLSRRQYLAARAVLVQRGLVVVEQAAGPPAGAVMRLRFAEDGPSVERDINAGLFEAVLARSSVTGAARALLATLAALADEDGCVEGLSSEEICEASGLSDRTYRRARGELLDGGEITLEAAGGGRSRRNRWRVRDPRTAAGAGVRAATPSRPLSGSQMPLMAAVRDMSPTGRSAAAEVEPAQEVGFSAIDPGGLRNPGRNPGVNPGQIRTPDDRETPAQTPAETPAPHARAGRESQNLRTTPPDPPEGGHTDTVSVIEEYVSDRGRRRRRLVAADPAEISRPTDRDQADWLQVRQALRSALGEEMFEVWLVNYTLRAVSAVDGALLIDGPVQTRPWVRSRYRTVLTSEAQRAERRCRLATDRELALLDFLPELDPTTASARAPDSLSVPFDQKEVV
jgi:hypothetical protein